MAHHLRGHLWLFSVLGAVVLTASLAQSRTHGSSDREKIVARVHATLQHINDGDVTGFLHDLSPDTRSGCDAQQLGQAMAPWKGLGFQAKSVQVESIVDKSAAPMVTGGSAELGAGVTVTDHFVKVGNDWYVDPQGKPCTRLFGGGKA